MKTTNTAITKPGPLGSNLTENAFSLIEDVVDRTKLTDPHELLPYVCDELMERYQDDSLEFHLKQMHLETTEDIVYSITQPFFNLSHSLSVMVEGFSHPLAFTVK